MKGLYGRVNPLEGRLAGAWEDMERAAGRCWVVFSPERISRGGFAREPLASETLLSPDRLQLTRRSAGVKTARSITAAVC